jgi:hypothetical protein
MKKILFMMFLLILLYVSLNAAEVSGKIKNFYGHPQVGTQVRICGWNDGEVELVTDADSDGVFSFTNLLTGFYKIEAETEDDVLPFIYIVVESEDQVLVNQDIIIADINSTPQGGCFLSGVVVDENNELVSGAEIVVQSSNAFTIDPIYSNTDSLGAFWISGIRYGSYDIYVYDGDQSSIYPGICAGNIVFAESENIVDSLVVQVNSSDFAIPGSGDGIISGIVTDENNSPSSDAIVAAVNYDNSDYPEIIVRSDENGFYEFTNLPNGDYRLVAFSPGYLLNAFPDVSNEGILISDENIVHENIDLQVSIQIPDPPEAFGSISGYVINDDDELIVGATLQITNTETEEVIEVNSGVDGLFAFSDLDLGEYILYANYVDEGCIYSITHQITFNLRLGSLDATGVIVELENNTNPDDNCVLSGQIVDQNNEPLTNYTLYLSQENSGNSKSCEPDENGNFYYDDLWIGQYRMYIRHNFEAHYYVVDGDSASIIFTESHQEINDIYFQFNTDYQPEINCKITFNIVQDIPADYNSYTVRQQGAYFSETDSIPSQQFTLDVPAGEYFMCMSMSGYDTWFYENTNNAAYAELLNVEENDSVFVVVDFGDYEIETFTVSGSIEDLDGNEIQGAEIVFEPTGEIGGNFGYLWDDLECVTSENGTYEITLAEGEYSLFVNVEGYLVQFWPGVTSYFHQDNLIIDQNLSDIDFTMVTEEQDGYFVSGNVTVDGEIPEEGSNILIVAVSSDEDDADIYTESVLCSADGGYNMDLDQPGNYYLLAVTNGTIPTFYDNSYDWEDADLVAITAGGVSGMDFDLIIPQTEGVEVISGTVNDENNIPVVGATVLMCDESGTPVAFATTNQSGQYCIAFLGDETYTFKATKMYYESYQIDVNPAEETMIDVVIGSILTGNEDVVKPLMVGLDNYPNPFNPETNIRFSIVDDCHAELSIYNVKGQKVRSLVDEKVEAGWHQVSWNGENELGESVSTGVYFMRLETPKQTVSRKINLLK